MNSIYLAIVCLAIAYVIFWCVRNDGTPPEKLTGPLAMQRSGEVGKLQRRRTRRIR